MPKKSDENPMDSKFAFWNDLPIEMRMECIKRMDFKTRMQLRATSKQDKLLVESAKKYHFEFVGVSLNVQRGLRVLCEKSDRVEVDMRLFCMESLQEFFVEAQQPIIQILKFSTSETIEFRFNFKTDEAVSNFLANFTDSMTFRCRKIHLSCHEQELVKFFLKNCKSAESIHVENPLVETHTEFTDIIQYPAIINAKTVELMSFKGPDTPYQLINEWLGKYDLELGKRLTMEYCDAEPLVLAEKFENRVVSKTDSTLRLRTNNPARHISIDWMCNSLVRYMPSWRSSIWALVIPSDQKEPE